jgi:UDP-N-acetylglucosamine:LPS N-acetylglucosamine transferase
MLQSLGMAKVIEQSKLTGNKLLTEIESMLKNLHKFESNALKAGKILVPGAEEKLINLLNQYP